MRRREIDVKDSESVRTERSQQLHGASVGAVREWFGAARAIVLSLCASETRGVRPGPVGPHARDVDLQLDLGNRYPSHGLVEVAQGAREDCDAGTGSDARGADAGDTCPTDKRCLGRRALLPVDLHSCRPWIIVMAHSMNFAIRQMSPLYGNPYRPVAADSSEQKGVTVAMHRHKFVDVVLAHAMLQEESFQRRETEGEMIAEITNKSMQEQRAELQRRLDKLSVIVLVRNGRMCQSLTLPARKNDTALTLCTRVGLELMCDVTTGQLESAGSVIDGELTLGDAGVDEGATLQLFEQPAAPFAEIST